MGDHAFEKLGMRKACGETCDRKKFVAKSKDRHGIKRTIIRDASHQKNTIPNKAAPWAAGKFARKQALFSMVALVLLDAQPMQISAFRVQGQKQGQMETQPDGCSVHISRRAMTYPMIKAHIPENLTADTHWRVEFLGGAQASAACQQHLGALERAGFTNMKKNRVQNAVAHIPHKMCIGETKNAWEEANVNNLLADLKAFSYKPSMLGNSPSACEGKLYTWAICKRNGEPPESDCDKPASDPIPGKPTPGSFYLDLRPKRLASFLHFEKKTDFISSHAFLCKRVDEKYGAGEAVLLGNTFYVTSDSGTYKPTLKHLEAAVHLLGASSVSDGLEVRGISRFACSGSDSTNECCCKLQEYLTVMTPEKVCPFKSAELRELEDLRKTFREKCEQEQC